MFSLKFAIMSIYIRDSSFPGKMSKFKLLFLLFPDEATKILQNELTYIIQRVHLD